jgi:WD40 repeat protein
MAPSVGPGMGRTSASPRIRIRKVAVLNGHQKPALEARFSPDGSSLVTVADDALRCWSVRTHQMRWQLDIPAGCLAFSPSGSLLAHTTIGGIVHMRSLDGALVAELPPHDPIVSSLAFSSDGKLLATGDHAGDVRFWEVATQRLMLTFHASTGQAMEGKSAQIPRADLLTFTPDGSRLAVDCEDHLGRLQLWQVQAPGQHATWKAAALDARDFPFDLRCSPDGQLLAFAHYDKEVIDLFDAHTLQPAGQIDLSVRLFNDTTKAIAFSPDPTLRTLNCWLHTFC